MLKPPFYLTFLVMLFFSISGFSQKTRKQLEAQRVQLKSEIKKVNRLLFAEQKKEKNALDGLRDINKKIKVREQLIATISEEREVLDKEIAANEKNIRNLIEKLNVLKEDYGKMIYKSYKSKSHQSKTLFLLSSESFNQAFKRLKYMNQYTDFRKKQGLEITQKTFLIRSLNDSLLLQKQLKDTLLFNETSQKDKIAFDKKEQEKLIHKIKRKERQYRNQLKKKQEEEKIVTAAIDKIIKDAIAKSNAKKGVKKSTGFALSPEAKVLASRFELNKGKLPWPVESGIITRRFGSQPHPTISGITVNSPGLHIVTDKNNSAESIFKGKVLNILTSPEGLKSVLVQHGNYISTYKNLENVYVSVDQEVNTGEALGKIFTDRVTGKTKLVFVLYKDTKKLNPASWISRR